MRGGEATDSGVWKESYVRQSYGAWRYYCPIGHIEMYCRNICVHCHQIANLHSKNKVWSVIHVTLERQARLEQHNTNKEVGEKVCIGSNRQQHIGWDGTTILELRKQPQNMYVILHICKQQE